MMHPERRSGAPRVRKGGREDIMFRRKYGVPRETWRHLRRCLKTVREGVPAGKLRRRITETLGAGRVHVGSLEFGSGSWSESGRKNGDVGSRAHLQVGLRGRDHARSGSAVNVISGGGLISDIYEWEQQTPLAMILRVSAFQ